MRIKGTLSTADDRGQTEMMMLLTSVCLIALVYRDVCVCECREHILARNTHLGSILACGGRACIFGSFGKAFFLFANWRAPIFEVWEFRRLLIIFYYCFKMICDIFLNLYFVLSNKTHQLQKCFKILFILIGTYILNEKQIET